MTKTLHFFTNSPTNQNISCILFSLFSFFQGLAVALLWDEARHQTSGKLTTSYYILILMELDNVVSSFQSSQVTLIYQGLWID
ncbi:hypothetical protein HanXRQr2_Chr04g0154841 [Helianthus annuus]|uniref:Uncharacterized protein n=1 Tax=Helianthus annuus TaxID=4232 RepID=A0A9K3NQM8_HELAN|nr:hypothetical protein HanXRQr2_Chr04g0154841 [Helianthus annuus]